MKRFLAVGLCLAVTLLCACGTVSNAVPSSAQLKIGQDLAAATAGLDAAVDAAELAHKSGVLIGANWALAKQAIAKAQGVIDVADTAYSAGDFATVSSSLGALPALVAVISQPTGAALGDGLVVPPAH